MASVRKKQRLIKKRTPYWSHRYARPFILQKLLRRMQAAMVLATGYSTVKCIQASQAGKLDKALAIANVLIDVYSVAAKTLSGEADALKWG